MKTFTKLDVEKRFLESSIKPSVSLYNISNSKYFNKMLFIVIPGTPIQDSRPRFSVRNDNMHTYNVNKGNLMKVFAKVYKNSILEQICVTGPFKIELRIYRPLVKKYIKYFDKKDKVLLEKEELFAPVKPDNDNYEKVHYDVLQDDEFMVILRDETIIDSRAIKYFVKTEKLARSEIYIYYSDKNPSTWYKTGLEESKEYLKYKVSKKYMLINNIESKKWKKTFYKNIKDYLAKFPKTDLIKTLGNLIKYNFSLDYLSILSDKKTKNDCIEDILATIERMIVK